MSSFYWFVWAVGFVILVVVVVLYALKHINKNTWNLFWLGFVLGMLWELPMSIANELAIVSNYALPPATFITPTPLQGPLAVIVISVSHSFWDAGLFLLGVFFVKLFCKEPYFDRFNIKELLVLIIFGQIQELVVELTSTFSDAWVFNTYWWNPALFVFNGHNITLMPQLIWLVASIVFYFISLKIVKNP